MSAVLREPLRGAQVWTGAEMRGRTDWMHHLTPTEISRLYQAGSAGMCRPAPAPRPQPSESPRSP